MKRFMRFSNTDEGINGDSVRIYNKRYDYMGTRPKEEIRKKLTLKQLEKFNRLNCYAEIDEINLIVDEF